MTSINHVAIPVVQWQAQWTRWVANPFATPEELDTLLDMRCQALLSGVCGCECGTYDMGCSCDSERLSPLASELLLVVTLRRDEVASHTLTTIFEHAHQHEERQHKTFCHQRPDVLTLLLSAALIHDQFKVVDTLLKQTHWAQQISLDDKYDFFKVVRGVHPHIYAHTRTAPDQMLTTSVVCVDFLFSLLR
jgi:hypothetical protein